MENARETVIIGAGIVGLCTAFFLSRRGRAVTVIDPDPEGDKASLGNAASFAVSECIPASLPGTWQKVPRWLLDPQGPLFIRPAEMPKLLPWLWAFQKASRPAAVDHISRHLALLNASCLEAAEPVFAATGYGNHVHHAGALTLYADRKSFEAERPYWQMRERLGIDFRTLEKEELWAREPALSRAKSFAVETGFWSHIDDPRDLHGRLLSYLRGIDVTVMAGTVIAVQPHPGSGVTCHLASGAALTFGQAVIAAGAFSARLARQVGDRVLLTSERGYNATLPSPGFTLHRPLVFAEEKTVATPIASGLRIGGAAEFAGLCAKPNYKRSEALVRAVQPAFKVLNTAGMDRWMGNRPATPDSLPVIGRSPGHADVYYAFGHGHLGLTQGPLTGHLLADLMLGRTPKIGLAPFGIARFS